MTIHYNVPGKKRKELATEIGRWLEVDVEYLGAPTFAYRIDYFTLDRDGNLSFDDRADSDVIEQLLEHLYDESFENDNSKEEPDGICISMPKSLFTETAMENLKNLVAAKGELLKKALAAESLPIESEDDRVSFPWFPYTTDPEEIKAYDKLVCAICEMAKNQKRVTAKEKEVENEKYAFRCFLLRLGFIGAEYKTARKILLRNLEGSASFKGGKEDVVSD
jgi:hypothetical protein